MTESQYDGMSDEQLMLAYAKGDEYAFKVIFSRYSKMIWSLCRSKGFPQDQADDLTQQTFFNLHCARADYKKDFPLKPWLFTIMYNLIRDGYRRSEVSKRALADHAMVKEVELDGGSMGTQDKSERVHKVQLAMSELNREQREVLELYFFAELSFKEIAQVLGVSQSTAKVRAHRAYEKLRERI